MTSTEDLVVLLDCDNTPLDNDHVQADLCTTRQMILREVRRFPCTGDSATGPLAPRTFDPSGWCIAPRGEGTYHLRLRAKH